MSRVLRRTYRLGARLVDAELRAEDGRLRGRLREGEVEVEVDAQARRAGEAVVLLRHEGRVVRAVVLREGDRAWVAVEGRTVELRLEEDGPRGAHHAGEEDFAVSPMTGTVVKVQARPGAELAAGDPLFVVEAMKMEYVVQAPRAVTVAEVRCAAGDAVDQGSVVVTFGASS
jgi:acetyl/propionyl-CoA carboxylase alpha subunit